ncbi:MAG: leucine-rich repeat protein [Paludibacteraceae bacterium]|nr:leucine-rich repeat protein [Paludibacteraceae bacterium]
MKQKILFWVALATMLWAGMTTANAKTNFFTVLGQKITLKDGETQIGNITIDQDTESKVLRIIFGEYPEQTLNVPDDVRLFEYSGDDFDVILVGFDQNLTINHSVKDHDLFFIMGSTADPIEVYFANNSITEDVTLTINATSAAANSDVFCMYNTHLHLNTLDLAELLSDKSKFHKLNLDINTNDGEIFYKNLVTPVKPVTVDLGYGDYHFAFTNSAKEGEIFLNSIPVSGLGRFDTYDANNYVSTPHGLCYYHDGSLGAFYKCDATMTYSNRYKGEVTLKYMPSEWAYFDDEEYSDWRIVQDCSGNVSLQITGAGDLSSLDPDKLPWMPYKELITSVTVSSNIMIPLTKLPESAFAEFKALTSANLAGITDMEELPANLFLNCPKLSEVYLPSMGLKSIGKSAFFGCQALTTLELPDELEDIGQSAFFSCYNLDVTLPKNLKTVGFRAFGLCNTVRMPKDIGEDIECTDEDGTGAWNSAFEITRLVFEGTMEEWLARDNKWIMNAWTNYTSSGGHLNIGGQDIEDLVIPNGTTELKPYAFANAVHIKTVKFPSTLTKIGKMSFYNCGLEAIDLPDNITELDESSFEYCEKAATLKLPKNLTVIPESAFGGCEALTEITWSENLTTIGVGAFEDCPSLTTLKLPETVTTVSHDAFSGCESLMEVTMPKSLKSISPIAFAGNIHLNKLTIPAGMGDVEELEKEELIKELLKDVPEEMHEQYLMQLYFPWVTEIRFGGDLNEWLSKSRPWLMKNLPATIPDFINEIYVPHEVNLYLSGSDEPLQEAVVPEGVTAIPEDAFHYVSSLKKITLPASMKEIGARAFEGCKNIQNLYIYAWNPPTLGKDAFEGVNGSFTPWYTARHNYEKAEGWETYVSSQLDYSLWPAPMRDDYVQVTVKEGQEAFGSVSLNVPEQHRTGGYESETELTVMEGGDITVVAEPAEGYRFVRWERWLYNGAMIASDWEEVSNEASYTTQALGIIPIGGSTQNTFRAVFEQAKGSFDISVTVKGIDPELVEITGAGTYTEGDNATLSFTLKDDEHYTFSMWLFDENNFRTTQTLSFENIDANHDVEIVFNVNKYTVTATVIPAGAGVVKGQGEYDYGTDYTLTLEPAEGWELKEWRDGVPLAEKSNTLTGTVYGAINIEVELVQTVKTYTVTFLDWDATVLFVEKVEEGKDAKGPDTNPEREGYKFVGWSKPITNITADLTVIAQYEKKDATGLGDVQGDNVQCTKVLRDGVLYIMYNGTMYNVQGQRLR